MIDFEERIRGIQKQEINIKIHILGYFLEYGVLQLFRRSNQQIHGTVELVYLHRREPWDKGMLLYPLFDRKL